jgi:hypothetical protein
LVAVRQARRCLRCGTPGSDWHHRRGRSVKDAHQHCPCNGVLLCKSCHDWAHAHPFDARRVGFIVSRSEPEPGRAPVRTYHGVIVLDCVGGFEYDVDQFLGETEDG